MDTPLAILFMIIFISGFLTGSIAYLMRYSKESWNPTIYLMKIFCGVFFSALTILIYEFFMGSAVITHTQDGIFYTFVGIGCFVISLLTFVSAHKVIERMVNHKE